jgi:hypothetical protein
MGPYDPAAQLLAPARRAGLMMIIVGALLMACSLCLGIFARVGPVNEVISRSGIDLSQATAELKMTPEELVRAVYTGMAVASLVVGVVFLLLGIFVRRGGMGSIVTSIIFSVLAALILVVQVLAGLVNVARAPGPTSISGLLVSLAFFGLFGLNLLFLFQAARASGSIRDARMHYQMQMWQYHQQMQMYGQAGYGYPQAPMQPPPPPPPNATGENPAGGNPTGGPHDPATGT